MLQGALPLDVAGAEVTAVRPDAGNAELPDRGVNLYLFQVTPNAAWRNADLPTRAQGGQVVQRPRIAVDLHYLFTFYGEETTLEAQRVVGSVARILHARPVLTRAAIEATLADAAFSYVAASDLAEEVERVKFTPLPLSLEELSKLWSVLFQTTYALSMVYQAGVVLIEGDEAPARALPVQVRQVAAFPFRRAVLMSMTTTDEDALGVTAGQELVLRGEQLGGEVVEVRVGEAALVPLSVTNREIRVLLVGAPLRAGVQPVQVFYIDGTASTVAPLVLRPHIRRDGDGDPVITVQDVVVDPDDGTRSATIAVTVDPPVSTRQRAVLYFNGRSPLPGTGTAYSFATLARTAVTNTLTFEVQGVQAGVYLVRIEIGGAESLLTVDPTSGAFVAPEVTIP